MPHNRKLVIGGAALTAARNNRHCVSVAAEIMDELEPMMVSTRYLDNAPFEWIGLMLRFGLKNEEEPHYQRINKKHGDLPVAIELDAHELRHVNRDELKGILTVATLKVLVHVAHTYGLPGDKFAEMLRDLRAAQANDA